VCTVTSQNNEGWALKSAMMQTTICEGDPQYGQEVCLGDSDSTFFILIGGTMVGSELLAKETWRAAQVALASVDGQIRQRLRGSL
jgi:hypothetical protein